MQNHPLVWWQKFRLYRFFRYWSSINTKV